MCKAASGVSFEDQILIDEESNSHCEILEKNGIKDSKLEPNFYKWECFPANGDYTTSVETWKFVIDQDFIPAWVDKKVEEIRVKDFVEKDWKKYHCIFKEFGNNAFEKAGFKSTLTAGKLSTLKAGNLSTLTAGHKSTLTAGENSVVIISYYKEEFYKVATRIITKSEANKPYKFDTEKGEWVEVKN